MKLALLSKKKHYYIYAKNQKNISKIILLTKPDNL